MFNRCAMLLICVAAVCLNSRAMACKCAPPPAPKIALKQAAAVFAGKVVEIEVDQAKYMKTVTFKVSRLWKGEGGEIVKVTTALHGATCGYGFKKGGEYMVYCYANKAKNGKPVVLRTNLCTRTRPMANAADDIKAIGKGNKPKSAAKGGE